MTDLNVQPINAPFQKTFGNDVFPLVLHCQTSDATLDDTLQWIASHRDEIDQHVKQYTSVVFRGFPLHTPEDFDACVVAFGYEGFVYKDSLSNAVRVNLTPNVFTANEAPSTFTIQLHHEMAQTPSYPGKLFFFCEKPADSGGATPLCRSDELFDALVEHAPQFMDDCEQKGLKYTNVMPDIDDPSSGMGRSWRSTLGVDAREPAETRLRQLGYSWEWLEDGSLRATTPVLPATYTLASGRKSFFNQLIAAFKGWKDARNDPTKAVTFGDGSPINPHDVQQAIDLSERYTTDVPWQAGDLALVDNHAAMHGRRSFEGKRRILASLVELNHSHHQPPSVTSPTS